jgi:predicted ATP-grasp superfamily ATP-dependent carboligase
VSAPEQPLLILGASVRAAAFSALRAGWTPLCADLFADADLRSRCRVLRLSGRYPDAFRHLFAGPLPGPWLYTGGLENHPGLIAELESRGRLLGNGAEVLRRARDPLFLSEMARRAGLPAPGVLLAAPTESSSQRWLVKPLAGAGGAGIRWWQPGEVQPARRCYWQEFIPGTPASALYVGDGVRSRCLALTRQLVGEAWLQAGPFRYCGSVGPIQRSEALHHGLERLGEELVRGTGLRGLFGVDGVLREGTFSPVEINPRYTASVEVVEHATGLQALAMHVRACQREGVEVMVRPAAGCVGKAVVYAPQRLRFPEEGPWQGALREPSPVEVMPDFADIPEAGTEIAPGHPVLTVFARGESEEECERGLRQVSGRLNRVLGQ